MQIGITERGDAALDHGWKPWVENDKPAILITKDPAALCPEIHKDMNIIVHCTITGMGNTPFEPNVPPSNISIYGMNKIIEKMGQKRVVLRIDPIIPKPIGMNFARKVLEYAPKGIRTRISFLDIYKHVVERFRKAGVPVPPYRMHAPIEDRIKMWEDLGKPEICGEPGMPCTGCVSTKDAEIFGITVDSKKASQRSCCACVAEKKELLNNRKRCPHGCLYCYWQGN